MRMTPTVIITGILALLAAITLIVVYWPYATRDMTPSDIFRSRTEVENAGRKIYLENGGKHAIVTSPAQMGKALRGEAGTHIVV